MALLEEFMPSGIVDAVLGGNAFSMGYDDRGIKLWSNCFLAGHGGDYSSDDYE